MIIQAYFPVHVYTYYLRQEVGSYIWLPYPLPWQTYSWQDVFLNVQPENRSKQNEETHISDHDVRCNGEYFFTATLKT
jgi:hypothetical protein